MIQKKFKTRGYALKVDALPVILSFIESYQGFHEEAICLILDELHRLSLKSSILDKEHLDEAVALVVSTLQKADRGDGIEDQVLANLQPIDAFEMPQYRYDPVKKFFYEQTRRPPIHGDASAKASLYRDRFLLLFQRLTRDPHFSAPAFDGDEHGSCEISPILSLIGQTGRRRWVMGVISQLEDGHFYLEDLTAAVEIDLSNYRITTGFFSENTIVLAEGEMLLNDIFQVKTCGFPPLEDRNKSLAFCAGLDLFGSGAQTKDEILRLSEDESRAVNEMFVILSDVWLDDEKTMRNLEVVLDGYENVEVVPSLFVFMGNFCSRPCNLAFNSYSMLRSQFGKLGQKVAACPRLMEKSTFLFIPGPDDIGPSTALPRCPLPMYLTQEFQRHVPNSFFMSNPCRIKFYTQEIVFFRQDLLYKMRRSCLMPPSTEETSDPFEHLVATITHQSHLCPLPLSVQPIIWSYDHCLHLYPTPHTIVLGDRSEQKAFKYAGTTCFNPGSFSKDSTFIVYRPSTGEVELSAI
ncbi:hypothetical protein Leryth_004313 [Lithospermum erythrorhizon]|nr:hypothetical protein Leryth_004313 [Lithospermum erythrorhizon]